MATIKEIAKACGVSVATVSNILNKKPGASEAKNLKARNTRSIGVIAEDMTIFSIPDIIDGITEYCEKVKYQILLTNLRLYKKYNDYYYHRTDVCIDKTLHRILSNGGHYDEKLQIYCTMRDHCISDGTACYERYQQDLSITGENTGCQYPREAYRICYGRGE